MSLVFRQMLNLDAQWLKTIPPALKILGAGITNNPAGRARARRMQQELVNQPYQAAYDLAGGELADVEGIGGAHGGAWKVAYADFTTAMMAFFMLLWLLNVAPPETLTGLAAYFTPTDSVTKSRAGSEGQLGIDYQDVENVTIIATAATPVHIQGKPKTGDQRGQKLDREEGDPDSDSDRTKKTIAEMRENAAFDAAQADIKAAIQKTPELCFRAPANFIQ